MKKEKKSLIIGISVLVVIIIGIIVLVNTTFFKDYLKKRDLRKITNTFYGLYYDEHNKDNNIKKYLSDFKNSGLGINLKDMQIYIEDRTNSGTNYKTLEKCDIENTKVTIYPKDPYTKKDIDIKFDLSCK